MWVPPGPTEIYLYRSQVAVSRSQRMDDHLDVGPGWAVGRWMKCLGSFCRRCISGPDAERPSFLEKSGSRSLPTRF